MTQFLKFARDDGTPIIAEIEKERGEDILFIRDAWLKSDSAFANAPTLDLTDAERERIEEEAIDQYEP